MLNKDKLILSAISAVMALSASTTTVAAASEVAAQPTEKCYGISKAGMNDCAAGVNSCAGYAVKDAQGDAFLLVPTGLCEKIVGGSLNEIYGKTTKKS